MDRTDRPNRAQPDSAEDIDPSEQTSRDTDVEVMGAYDDIDGTPVFVIAALDREEAWIAVEDGRELEPADWC